MIDDPIHPVELPLEERLALALCTDRFFDHHESEVCPEHAKQAKALMVIVQGELDKKDALLDQVWSERKPILSRFRRN